MDLYFSKMTRRNYIQQLLLLIGSSMLIPGCVEPGGLISEKLKYIKLTANQEKIFTHYLDNLLPSNQTYGARELKLNLFILTMFDDCYSESDQERLGKGLMELEKVCEKKSKDFIAMNYAEKKSFYQILNTNKTHSQDFKFLLKEVYRWAVKGYQNSEYVMTKLVPYQLVPGHFYGCIKLKA
ncbi:gluconate 2-dehydrogenase subunit 3 family protein [Pedobacter lithocola]|nr:gluconate 2-dehydrogenase subunit 3 family protein [Pedobacter petrophilus]